MVGEEQAERDCWVVRGQAELRGQRQWDWQAVKGRVGLEEQVARGSQVVE
ncbi:MAG: hypothetical protein ETSY2_52975 [Candidatus Entotheonella gemina]|uniref:Uncharacterized protein n=1 Tax=Candidatus Entotheonella gemina TaxID=1429439 RepID=W4L3K5_9BACT|nr:MAG: hypothetical protein ETSY2_52975 [Candidatus Entotheonella gemina]